MRKSWTFRAVRDLQILESMFCRAVSIMGVNASPNTSTHTPEMVLGNGGSPDFRARSSLGPQEAIPSLQGILAPPNVSKQCVIVFSKAASLYHAHLPPTRV